MSHRAFDDLSRLRSRLAATNAIIAIIRSEKVIDLVRLADLKSKRAALVEQIGAKEIEARA